MADPDDVLLDADAKMDGAVKAFERELNGIRTGRAHPSLIETLAVDYYGASTPLNQLGSINAPESRLLTIQVPGAEPGDRRATHPSANPDPDRAAP
jgi:ribosome recycling factor